MIFSLLISPPILSQQNTDTGWKVVNKDVYKKDTSGRVVIGNTEIKEKLNVAGDVRIDGLRGNYERWVYVDRDGKLRADKRERKEGETGPPDWVKLPDNAGGFGGRPDWVVIDPGGKPLTPCHWQINDDDRSITTSCKVGIGLSQTDAEFEIQSPGYFSGNTFPIIRNTNMGGAGFRFIPGGGSSEWKVFATGPANGDVGANKLVFKSTSSDITVMTLSADGDRKTEIFGDLNVVGNLTASSPSGINFTGNLKTSGYLQSGNSIYIDGRQTGTDQSNKIYSSNYILSFLGGTPTEPEEGNIRVGIGMNPALTDAKFTIKGNSASNGPVSHFKIINDFNEDVFSINETPLITMPDFTQTEINIGKTNFAHGLTNINITGTLEVNGNLHVCTGSSCGVGLSNVFVNDQNFHIKSNAGEDVNIQLETQKGNSWLIFSKDYTEVIENWCSVFGLCDPDQVEVNYFGIYDSKTNTFPLIIDPYREKVNISKDLYVCRSIVAGNVTVKNNWCDYVFDKNYYLSDLDKVKDYVILNKHLPEIPSTKEVEEKGLNLGSMMEKLMKKIEEIFLYLFKHEDRLNSLENDLNRLKEENQDLKIQFNNQRSKLDSLILVLSDKK